MKNSDELRLGRKRAGLTQTKAARLLGLSQAYLSLLENGERAMTSRVARLAGKLYGLPNALPLPTRPDVSPSSSDKLVRQLAGLGYPGYAHVRPRSLANPAQVVLEAVTLEDRGERVARAIPWVLSRYPDLDWEWLVDQTRLKNAQNRVGFLVSLARQLLDLDKPDPKGAERLREAEWRLESAKLVAESTLDQRPVSDPEREWIRENRPELARRWNVLSTLTVEQVRLAG